jgi:hypothetical protein
MRAREVQCDFSLQHGAGPRTAGVHVSELIRDVALRMGLLLSKEDEGELDWTLARYRLARGEDAATLYPAAIYRVALGLAWERWYGEQCPEVNFHDIGEIERDGIIGSPDGLSVAGDGALVVHEIKLTWKSSRDGREDAEERLSAEWMWLAQIKCYMAMLARTIQAPVTRAELHVFWVCGNYRGSGPQARRYELEFMAEEVEKTWIQIEAVRRWRAR